MKIKIVVEADKKSTSVEIGAETLHQILHKIPCTKDTKEFFRMVSEIPSEKVQEIIAQIDTMFPEVLKSLSMKHHPNVLRNLMRSDNGRKIFTNDQVSTLLTDNYAIESLISSLDSFDEVDADQILSDLVKHENPDIRYMIADNYSVPKKYKKILSKDQDPDVRYTAQKALNER
jgi:hypothetical protein